MILNYQENRKNVVEIIERPFEAKNLYENYPKVKKEIMVEALRCQYCEDPECVPLADFDMPGMMRRLSVGNFMGARKIADSFPD